MRHDFRFVLAAALLLAPAAPVHAFASPADTAGGRAAPAAQGRTYFPEPGERWERRRPQQVGMDSARLREAVEFALANESRAPRNLALAHYQSFGREPFGEAVGPFRERGDPTGVVVRNGYIVAEWGDPHRVDMTFSVTKSFLSTVVGVALDRGLIRSVDDRVAEYTAPVLPLEEDRRSGDPSRVGRSPFLDPFSSPHNRTITWNHLLRQTSDWEGTLWGKPDWADRPSQNTAEWLTRTRNAPGTVYEYNDVRVNALALAALEVWRRPLPEVLREEVMEPIGASRTWRWYGYENSWVVLDGHAIQSVSGGGHWGGGMFISARDMARFGYLTLRRGRWGNRQVLSEAWVRMALTPTPVEPGYGFMNWFLNTEQKRFPSAPASAFAHLGNGTNLVYVDPENDLVVVARWIDNAQLDGLIQRVLASVQRRG
ncbi:MAG TPA: serine hydrolase [Longimicrobiaceae bacterium]|nr:serine hydrolase [Longimicrobiaceae bacterium]